MAKAIKNIVVVGGGTAGWLAANHLAKELKPSAENGISIRLIESPNIPTIGVGEGTVPMMRQSLQYLGISETEFIQSCDVTFKQGIKFVDWVHNPVENKPSYYHHIFDYPNINDVNLTAYWLSLDESQRKSFVDTVSLQGQACDLGLAPKTITIPEFQGRTAYAYHLDAGKFADLLTKNAVERLGVELIKDDVVDIPVNGHGEIAHLVTENHGIIEADLYVDCTGFRSLLLGEALGVGFVDKSDVLFADHAVVMQVPYESNDAPIPSYTVSTAKQSGWIWDIGLTTRRGVGHVYASDFISHEQAEDQLRNYVGAQHQEIATRKIKMNIGYREQFWHKNCVAIGLSQGFVEPLEATGLLVFDATSKMLAKQFPSNELDMPLIAEQFNEKVKLSWEKVIDFIKLHYCISKRDDSDFWLANRDVKSIPDSLLARLERWKYQPPTEYDFFSGFEIFNLENYLYVLYGMEYQTDITGISSRFDSLSHAPEYLKEFEAYQKHVLNQLPKHRDLINKIKMHGLQKI